jgi:hypothetical protein
MTRNIPFLIGDAELSMDIPDSFGFDLPSHAENRTIDDIAAEAQAAWATWLAAWMEPALPPRGTLAIGNSTVPQPFSREKLAKTLAAKIAAMDAPTIRSAFEAQRAHQPERRP